MVPAFHDVRKALSGEGEAKYDRSGSIWNYIEKIFIEKMGLRADVTAQVHPRMRGRGIDCLIKSLPGTGPLFTICNTRGYCFWIESALQRVVLRFPIL